MAARNRQHIPRCHRRLSVALSLIYSVCTAKSRRLCEPGRAVHFNANCDDRILICKLMRSAMDPTSVRNRQMILFQLSRSDHVAFADVIATPNRPTRLHHLENMFNLLLPNLIAALCAALSPICFNFLRIAEASGSLSSRPSRFTVSDRLLSGWRLS